MEGNTNLKSEGMGGHTSSNMSGMGYSSKHYGMDSTGKSYGMGGHSDTAHFKSRAPLGSDPRTWSPSSKKSQSTGTTWSMIDRSHQNN